MGFIKKHLLLVSTLSGAILGYIFLHPFARIINAFFHRHPEGYIHLHWHDILGTLVDSFDPIHWPNALSYIVISGLTGYFFGKTIYGYKTINEQLEKFSIIGIKASSVLHDLNNPLTGIIGYVELVKSKINNPRQISYCEKIEEEATRISKMIMDIKMLAQGKKKIELSKTPTDLKSFLKNIISKMTLHCDVKIDSKLKEQVSIDRNYFERVLWNLIKNANEALEMTKNPKIEISITDLDNYVIICISDNGPGIPKKILKNLFKLGQTFGKKDGSGIGLYNCKEIVEAHGGEIWIESKVKIGTKVYIKIPK
jgi:signal transduction histidine kinase